MALRYPLRNEQHWHNKKAFDKSIIPVTDINGLVHLARMIYQANTTLEVLSNLAPAFAQMGDLLFDQTAIDKYLAIEK
jgi:acetyl-CoA C-acetyltransferase